jgi:hypothetical protein
MNLSQCIIGDQARSVGQFQKSARANAMSAFPPLATELGTSLLVRFVAIRLT